MENRYRMLSDDKARGEHEARLRLDRGCDEIADARRTLEELKFLIAEKTKLGCGLVDELTRAKRALDEKCYESSKLKEEALAKGNQVADDHTRLGAINQDIDSVKGQRAEMAREIQRLREVADQKTHEAAHQADKLNALQHECARVQARIDDLNKLIEARSHDLMAKQRALEDTERELARTRDHNAKVANEVAALRRDIDRTSAENHDAQNDLKCLEARNSDLSHQIRDAEARIK